LLEKEFLLPRFNGCNETLADETFFCFFLCFHM